LVGGAAPGNETVSYTPGAPPVLRVSFASGVTRAQDVVDLINADGGVPFAASLDHFGADPADRAGQGAVVAGVFVNATSGGSGTSLDLGAGIRLTNGEGQIAIDTSGAETVEDLVNILNRPEYGLLAKVNDAGDGIDVRSRRSGADFTIGENGGTLAADLGIRTFVGSTRLEDFNRGKGVVTDDAHHLTLDHDDGSGNVTTYRINLSNDAFGDFSGLAALPTGSLDLTGSFQGASGNKLRILFAEDTGATTHSAALSGNDLTVTIGRSGLVDGETVDLDAVFQGLAGADFTGSIHYTPGDLHGAYTVGTDNGAAVAFSGGGPPLTVDRVNARIGAATGGAVTAGIATVGNGIDLSIDNSGGQTLRAHGIVAERLGFLDGSSAPGEAFDSGGTLSSSDRNTQEVQSAFNSLLRLREALQKNDTIAIGDAFESLEEDLNRATFARSEAGARVRSLETLKLRLEDEEVQLRATLSEAIDADLAEVISDFTARQFALQASLQTTASLLQMSVLNFI
jgi:flagellar hook-associated protein 3 FlgL